MHVRCRYSYSYSRRFKVKILSSLRRQYRGNIMPTSQEEVKPLGCDGLVSLELLLRPGRLSKSDTSDANELF